MSNRREIMLTASPQYLIQRRQTYYYRRRIPLLLQPLFDGIEFTSSHCKPRIFRMQKGWQLAMMTGLINSSIKRQ
jgi:hypothetical protein